MKPARGDTSGAAGEESKHLQTPVLNQSEISAKFKDIIEEENPKTKAELSVLRTSVVHMNKKINKLVDSFVERLLDEYSKVESSFKKEIKDKLKDFEINPFEEPVDFSGVENNLLSLKRLMQRLKMCLDKEMSKEISDVSNALNTSTSVDPRASMQESTLHDKMSLQTKYKKLKNRYDHAKRQLLEKMDKIRELEFHLANSRKEIEKYKARK
jgi:predicted  nucleic acid-binding Zn-ribbon protein